METEDSALIPPEFRVYCRRWLMLFIFVCFSFINSCQWIQYSIIENIVIKYYNVGSEWVDWTSMIFMLPYIFLVVPAMKFLERKGLRKAILIGSFGTAAGSCIKVASVKPNLFLVTFLGQTIVAISQVFMLSVPPRLSAVWFAADEVSIACSIGVFGNMMGVALGFLIPPIIVKDHDNLDDIGSELALMFYITAGFSTVVFIAAVLFFQDKPPSYPSIQQALQEQSASANEEGFWNLVKRLWHNSGYMIVVIAFAINQGVVNALSTLLNELILKYFENGEELAGRVGLFNVVSGMAGGIVLGVILGKTKKFKEVTLVVYALSLVGMLAFTFVLSLKNEMIVNIVSCIFGFFLGGYMPLAMDFGAELTYPEQEGMVSGILMLPTQVTGMLFTIVCGLILRNVGPFWANMAMCCTLLLGTFLHVIIRPKLRRQEIASLVNTSVQISDNLASVAP